DIEHAAVQRESVCTGALYFRGVDVRAWAAERVRQARGSAIWDEGQRGEADRGRRHHAIGIERQLGRIGADAQHPDSLELALTLEVVLACGDRPDRACRDRETEKCAHQKLPLTPMIGRIGNPVKYCR